RTSLSHSYSKTCRRHPFLREIQIQVCSVTLRQQYRRRLHPLHVLLNILYRIYNLDDAIAFRFPPTVLADPVVCLKRALSLKNSYVDDFGILPTDSDSVILHVLQCRQGRRAAHS
ncbi:hypothetical protein M405DRAFT_938008, partial [Rhizopogon salebrosus TDB-379]